jgi:hypothetical protein
MTFFGVGLKESNNGKATTDSALEFGEGRSLRDDNEKGRGRNVTGL